MFYLFVLLTAFALSLLLTPLAAKLGHRLDLVDRPGGRRKHRGVIPRTGGLAIFGAFFVTVAFVTLVSLALPIWLPATQPWFPPRTDIHEMRRLLALLAGSIFCAGAGLLDDRFELSALPQYALQFGAACIAIGGLIFIKHVNNPLAAGTFFGAAGFPWWLVWPLTVFWFVGMMNTVNFLDGLSGLVAGVTVILCAVLAVHMIFVIEPPQLSVSLLPLALGGAALGFLPFNFAPAKIFLGGGTYFLGFAIAALGIIGGARVATVMLVLGLPALDVAWLIVTRTRRGLSPGTGGRDHLHLRLLDRGWGERKIVVGYWTFCALFGLLTLTLPSRLHKLIALLVLVALALAVLAWASREDETEDRVAADGRGVTPRDGG